MALQRVAGADEGRRSDCPAAPPPGHRIRLRRGAAEHRAIAEALEEHSRQIVRRRVVDQLVVAEIEQDPDSLTGRLVGNCGEVLL